MMFTLAQLGSAFIAPALAGAGALAIGIPIAIHLLSRLRRKRENWGAMRFLRLAYQQQKNKLRLEQWLLLLTRCLLVALIGLALAGPVVGGSWAAWFGTLLGSSGGGRTVHVVIDDALPSGVEDNAVNQEAQADPETQDNRTTRLEALKAEALAWLSAVGAGDRVVLWTTTRGPGEPQAISAAGQPRGDVAAALEALEPGYGAADWEGVVAAIARDVAQRGSAAVSSGGGDVVAVLSGFARGDGALEEPAAAGIGDVGGATGALQRLGDIGTVVLTRPDASRPNVQILSATPRRAAVLATDTQDAGGQVEARLIVRRFGDTAEAATASLTVDLLRLPDDTNPPPDADAPSTPPSPGLFRGGAAIVGERIGSATRDVRFGVGQDTATVSLPVRWSAGALGDGPGALDTANPVDLGLRATLTPAAESAANPTPDALPADDVAYGLVRILRQLRIALIGGETSAQTAGPAAARSTDLGPAVFVRSALAAGLDERALDLLSLPAGDSAALADALGPEAEPIDALFILSPSRLGASAWTSIGTWVRDGGAVWILPDADELAASDGSSTSGASGGTSGGAGWATAMVLGLRTGTTFGPLMQADPDAPATPRVGGTWAAPEALAALSGEWDALLGPVRISAWRPILLNNAPTPAEPDPTQTQTQTSDAALAAQTWIALNPAGDAAAPAPAWLVQQPLGRGTVLLLGSSLDTSWTNLPAKPLFPALIQESLRHALARRLPPRTFAWDEQPPETTTAPDLVALNVQADAGDTTALTEAALSAWWDDAVGPWSFVPPESQGGPASVLTTGAPSLPLGRYLLWAVLGLVLLESLLSRRFSHATVRSG